MLCKHTKDFIQSKYFPPKFVWKDPRNLTKNDIRQLCDHIRSRQDEFGADEGLRFHAYFDGNGMVRAQYGTRDDERKAAARANKQKTNRLNKRADEQRKDENNQQIDPALLTSQNTTPGTHIIHPSSINDAGGYIGEADMQILIANGFSSMIPINGPNDGLPRYFVSAAALNKLKDLAAAQADSSSNEENNSRPDASNRVATRSQTKGKNKL